MKTCTCRGIKKPLESFYAHTQCVDGRFGKCIECVRVGKSRSAGKPGETDWQRAKDRIRYVSGPHGQFPTPPKPAN